MSWLGKKDEKKDRDKKLTTDTIRIRINRLVNDLPTEIAILEAELNKDKYGNTIIIHGDTFKEEFPSITDNLISDVLYKLESYGLTRDQQLEKVKENIQKKEKVLSRVKDGKLTVNYLNGDESSEININVETEKSNLKLLKCVEYTLANKKRNGSFEKVELDGTRCLSYVIRDGELIPYWFNSPTTNGEPITLIADISLRKKYFYDNEIERIQDLRDVENSNVSQILKVIALALIVIVAIGCIGWTIWLAKWSADLHDESLQPQLDDLNYQITKAKQECAEQLSNQVTNNGIIIDWATLELQKDIDLAKQKLNAEEDINNINI